MRPYRIARSLIEYPTLLLLLLLLRGKDETPDIEDLGSVLHDSSIQTLRQSTISLLSPMVTQVRQ